MTNPSDPANFFTQPSSYRVDQEKEKLAEEGIKNTILPPTGMIPPNAAKWAIPHYSTFSAISNAIARTYRYTFDEALRDGRCNANAMRFDPIIAKAIDKRIKPVVQLEWQLEPVDPSDPKQVENAYILTECLHYTPKLQRLMWNLMQAFFYGRYGSFLRFDYRKTIKGQPRLTVADHYPLHGDKLVFKFDGTPGILVNTSEYQGTKQPTDRGMAHFLTESELETFIWHEFEPIDADFYENELAGSVHGMGFRGKLYWYWWLKNNLQSQMLDFLQKIGQGFTVFYYESGNEQSLIEVREAAQEQIGNNVYLFPRNRDGQSAYAGPGIQYIPIPMQGSNFFFELIRYIDDIMTDYILGETLTTAVGATGMGSGVAQAHEDTADDRVKYDAKDLEYPLQRLVETLNRWNFPGNPCPKFKFMVDKRNPGEFMEAVSFAVNLGMDVDEDDIRDVLGLPRPQPGHSVLNKLGSLDPTAMNMTPQGVPMAGQPGPQPLDPNGQPMDPNAQPMDPNQMQQGMPVVQGQPVDPNQMQMMQGAM